MSPGTIPPRDQVALRSLARRIDPSDPGAHNNLGVLYYERGLLPEAIAAFSHALELDPRMAVARRNLERVQRETGYYDGHVAGLRERLSQSPGRVDLRQELGRAYAVLGNVDEAATQFEAAIRDSPNDPAPLIQLGLLETQRGRQEEATACFERACALDPRSAVSHTHLGHALYNQGLVERAKDVLERALELNPANADANYLLGFVYGELGQHEKARVATKSAMELNPALGVAQANLEISSPADIQRETSVPRPASVRARDEDPGRAHLNLGLAFRKRGYLADALREYRLALEAGEVHLDVLQGLAEVHLLRRDIAAALELYDQLLDRRPGHAGLWTDKGVCLHLAGRREEARAAWGRAVELDSSNALAWNNLGVAQARDRDPTKALASFETALRSRPGLSAARLNLALLHAHQRQYRAALDDYRAVLHVDPDDAGAWNGIGQVLMDLKQFDEARNAFARAVDADADLAVAHYNLGFCLSHLGRFDEALQETKRALELESYYVPQRFALTVDLQFEETTIPVAVSVHEDQRHEVPPGTFEFEPGLLDEIFADLAPDEVTSTVTGSEGADEFTLARDYMAKGLLDLASAEASRAVRRGAPTSEGAIVEGEIFMRRGLFGEALERFHLALEQEPNSRAALRGTTEALVALDRGAEAVSLGDRLVTAAPTWADAYAARARARRLVGAVEGARRDAEEAARHRPGDPDLLLLSGSLARAQGDLEGAFRIYSAALQLDEGLAQAWHELGVLEEQRGNREEASAAHWHAVRILPTHLESTLALAWLLRRDGVVQEAIRLLVDFLLAEPMATDVLTLLGQLLLDDHRPLEAQRVFERALRYSPDHLGALFHLGVALARRREYGRAVEAWERVVELSPTGPLAAEARRHARSAQDLAVIFRDRVA